MEFCAEIAILQNVFSLAKKKSKNLLDCHARTSDFKQIMNIVVDGLTEIFDGLDSPRNDSEKEKCMIQMHYLLFYKLVSDVYKTKSSGCCTVDPVQSSERVQTEIHSEIGENDLNKFSELFPNFSPHVFFGLVEKFHMEHLFLEFLGYLPSHTFRKSLKDFGDYILLHHQHNTSGLILIPVYLKALLLQLFPSDISPDRDTVERRDFENHHEQLLAILQCFSDFLKLPDIVQHQENFFDSITAIMLIIITVQNKEKSSNLLCQDYNIEEKIKLCDIYDKDMNTLMSDPRISVPSLGEYSFDIDNELLNVLNSKSISHKWIPLLHSLLNHIDIGETGKRFDGLYSLVCPPIPLVPVGKKFCIHVLMVLEQFQQVLFEISKAECDEDKSSKMLQEIEKTIDDIKKVLPVPCVFDDDHINFDDVEEMLLCIKFWLKNYTDCLDYILNSKNYLLDERILTFFEENNAVLVCEKYLTLLFKQYAKIISEMNYSVDRTTRLFNIILDTFSSLPLNVQDIILCERIKESKTIKSPDKRNIRQMLITSFNRLSLDDWQKTTIIFSQTLLLDPAAVLTKCVETAIKCNGQTNLVVDLLYGYPLLCNLKSSVDKTEYTYLCDTLHSFIASNALNSKEEINLLNFVTLLLKGSQHCKNAETSVCLLSTPEFLKQSVLPYIDLKNWENSSHSLKLLLCLKMLNVVLGIYKGKQTENSPSWYIPIIACLCDVYHECIALWDASTEDKNIEKLNIKDLTTQNIRLLTECVYHNHENITDSMLAWLKKRIQPLHWTVPSLLADILCLHDGSASLISHFEHEAKKIIRNSKHLDLLLLLKYVSVRDETTEALIKHWSKDVHFDYEEIIHSLSQLLPHCLQTEWYRIVQVIVKMIEARSVQAPSYDEFYFGMEKTSSGDEKFQICAVQVLSQTVLVLKEGRAMPNSAWNHIGSGFVSVVQNMITECINQEKTDIGRKSILAHCIGHISIAVSHVPDTTADMLLVLLMNITNQYKEGSSAQKALKKKTENRSNIKNSDTFSKETEASNINDFEIDLNKMNKYVSRCFEGLPDSRQRENLLKLNL